MTNLKIVPVNDVYVRIKCDDGIARALQDKFSFEIPGARFHPAVKARRWDGILKLFHLRTHLLYRGLVSYVVEFCKTHQLSYEIDPVLIPKPHYTKDRVAEFLTSLKLPKKFGLREYQVEAFIRCVNNGRGLFVLPTGSGKSLVIYWLVRWFQKRTLIIVDSLNLIHQMQSDFQDYGFTADHVHLFYYGQKKDTAKPIVLTTWQSAVKQPKSWFQQFKLVIGDEAHQYEAKSFKTIMESLKDCPYRFGFTGTLTGTATNQMVLEGLFGKYHKLVSTKDLIDQGHLSEIDITCAILKYPKADRKELSGVKYSEELDFLYEHEGRNAFIRKLAYSLKGNTLVLFQRVEQHGIPLYKALQEETTTPVYYVSGMIDGIEREEIRKIVNEHKQSITVASVGTFSRGVNIPNINNIIFASPSKSQVRVLQSIGRGLRKSKSKTSCKIYDIADDLSLGKHKNFTLKHFIHRLEMYVKEDFAYKTYSIPLD